MTRPTQQLVTWGADSADMIALRGGVPSRAVTEQIIERALDCLIGNGLITVDYEQLAERVETDGHVYLDPPFHLP